MRSRLSCWSVAGALLTILLVPSGMAAQEGFLFGPPRAQLTLRTGPVIHRAGGDLFEFFQRELTLDDGDFRALAVGGELAIYLHPRVDLGLGIGTSAMDVRSELRDWEDAETGQPIEQTTTLRVVPVTASAKIYPFGRGQRISSLAWIPARTTPYIGGGGGMSWHRLRQVGEFVHTETEEIFWEEYTSSSGAATAHAFVGVDHWLTPRFGFGLEGRYTLGSTRPQGDFINWDTLDLSGWQLGVGISYRW